MPNVYQTIVRTYQTTVRGFRIKQLGRGRLLCNEEGQPFRSGSIRKSHSFIAMNRVQLGLCLTLLFVLFLVSPGSAQIIPAKDTMVRDIGISVNWRYLPFPPTERKVSDIVGGFHFAIETRAHNFWIQTGVLVNWNSDRGFNDGHSFLITVATPYEFQILKRRLYIGIGPTFNYYYAYQTFHDFETWSDNAIHGISFGAGFEITVPIWKGLSMETCVDASIGPLFNESGPPDLFFPAARFISIGINYRIPAYPK